MEILRQTISDLDSRAPGRLDRVSRVLKIICEPRFVAVELQLVFTSSSSDDPTI
jgi:hypothetical protein